MSEPIDIHDCQDWLRTAPLKEAQEFVWWAQGVIDGRVLDQPKRKRRSDAGLTRADKELLGQASILGPHK